MGAARGRGRDTSADPRLPRSIQGYRASVRVPWRIRDRSEQERSAPRCRVFVKSWTTSRLPGWPSSWSPPLARGAILTGRSVYRTGGLRPSKDHFCPDRSAESSLPVQPSRLTPSSLVTLTLSSPARTGLRKSPAPPGFLPRDAAGPSTRQVRGRSWRPRGAVQTCFAVMDLRHRSRGGRLTVLGSGCSQSLCPSVGQVQQDSQSNGPLH